MGRLDERYGAAVDAELKRVVGDAVLPLYDMVRYHMGWVDENGRPLNADPGKRLRPLLCLLACDAVGGQIDVALPAAAALELIHNFTLIHDDVMDADHERRHRRTVWSIWGSAHAINAGDLLYSLGIASMSQLVQRGVSASNAVTAIGRLEQVCVQVIEGQYLDLEFESRLDVSPADYIEMIGKKSAALISFPMEIGALVGGADKNIQSNIADAGRAIGLVFQIRDDFLGVWGDRRFTGKPVGGDIMRKKKSLPAVLAFDTARDNTRARLREIYEGSGPVNQAVPETLKLMDDLGVRKSVEDLAEMYAAKARSSIQELQIGARAKDEFSQMLDFVVNRNA